MKYTFGRVVNSAFLSCTIALASCSGVVPASSTEGQNGTLGRGASYASRLAAAHASGRFLTEELSRIKPQLLALDAAARKTKSAARTTSSTPVCNQDTGCTPSGGGGGKTTQRAPLGYTLIDDTGNTAANGYFTSSYLGTLNNANGTTTPDVDDASIDIRADFSDGTSAIAIAVDQPGRFAVLRPDGSSVTIDFAHVAATTSIPSGLTASVVRSSSSWQDAYNHRFALNSAGCQAALAVGTGIYAAIGAAFLGPIGGIVLGGVGAYVTTQVLERHTTCHF